MRTGISITLRPSDRRRLAALARDRNAPHRHVWRAEIVLLSANGVGTHEIMRRTGKSKTCVWRWQERFMQAGYDGLLRDKTRPSRIPPLGSDIAERVVALTRTDPPVEATHWTASMMAKAVGISASSVQRIWHAHGLQPHRVQQFKLSNDPKFIDKLRDDDPRLQTTWHNDAVRRSRCTRRQGHWPLHAAPSSPRVYPLPQRHRGAGAGQKDRARGPRQLRRPQASESAAMARPTPALHLPLHADLLLVAQRRRGLLRQTRETATKARCFSMRCRP